MAVPPTKVYQLSAIKLTALIVSLAALGLPMWAHGQSEPCTNPAPPPGAQSLGYNRLVFCVTPTVNDIDNTWTTSSAKLYSGSWYDKNPPPIGPYVMSGKTLVITAGGGVSTQTHRSTQGALPLLLAGAGFYVEFAEWLSDNDADHWPAVWLMPQEHDGKRHDYMPGDPPGSERFMELDADEGGFNPGHHGAMIYWSGTWPNYQKQQQGNDPRSTFGMDRTQQHIFGLSYDPAGKKVTWWVDGVNVGNASTETVPSIVNSYHYYLNINHQTHKLNHPYMMYIAYFSAWSKAVPPKPPAGVKAEPVPQ